MNKEQATEILTSLALTTSDGIESLVVLDIAVPWKRAQIFKNALTPLGHDQFYTQKPDLPKDLWDNAQRHSLFTPWSIVNNQPCIYWAWLEKCTPLLEVFEQQGLDHDQWNAFKKNEGFLKMGMDDKWFESMSKRKLPEKMADAFLDLKHYRHTHRWLRSEANFKLVRLREESGLKDWNAVQVEKWLSHQLKSWGRANRFVLECVLDWNDTIPLFTVDKEQRVPMLLKYAPPDHTGFSIPMVLHAVQQVQSRAKQKSTSLESFDVLEEFPLTALTEKQLIAEIRHFQSNMVDKGDLKTMFQHWGQKLFDEAQNRWNNCLTWERSQLLASLLINLRIYPSQSEQLDDLVTSTIKQTEKFPWNAYLSWSGKDLKSASHVISQSLVHCDLTASYNKGLISFIQKNLKDLDPALHKIFYEDFADRIMGLMLKTNHEDIDRRAQYAQLLWMSVLNTSPSKMKSWMKRFRSVETKLDQNPRLDVNYPLDYNLCEPLFQKALTQPNDPQERAFLEKKMMTLFTINKGVEVARTRKM